MKIYAAILALAAMLPCSARTAADFFSDAPVDAVPMLGADARADMIAYFQNGIKSGVANAFGGKSHITALDSLRLTAQLSDAAKFQVAVIPGKSDTIVAYIETVASPVNDSSISFYRTGRDGSLQRLPDPVLPSATDYVPKQYRKQLDTVELPSIFFIGIDYDPAQRLFLIYNNSFDNLPAGQHPEAAAIMDKVRAYRYDGRKLVPVKKFVDNIIR